jgi:hypothetical protein
MAQRRRYATRVELAEMLASVLSGQPAPDEVIEALAQLGAPVDTLVKITVDEDVTPDLQ